MVNPYIDEKLGNKEWIRRFDPETNPEDLVWHQDEQDRLVHVLSGEGWQFQYENELPFKLHEDEFLIIKKYEYHRLIKGHTELILKIEQL